MKKFALAIISAGLLFAACSQKQPVLDVSLSDKFEGQTVEVMNFLDSTSLASAVVTNGKAQIVRPDSTPVFASVLIDGRTRAFYVVEPGTAFVNDSTNSAIGTPLNDKFSGLLSQLDSIENLDDMGLYMDFVEQKYNENKHNPIGYYFGIEAIKYAPLEVVDSILASAPEALKNSPKAQYYRKFAELRAATAPGQPFIDFQGETIDGKQTNFASYVTPGKFTLIDFWASWCPYCVKELPEMAALYDRWKDNGLEIVGVAVRDTPEDSKGAISKFGISWPVMLNTQRKPYDIYGFSGIPHHMLIGPDGKIVSRDESLAQIENRLKEAANEAQNDKNTK